jgi:hypothetical protein
VVDDHNFTLLLQRARAVAREVLHPVDDGYWKNKSPEAVAENLILHYREACN